MKINRVKSRFTKGMVSAILAFFVMGIVGSAGITKAYAAEENGFQPIKINAESLNGNTVLGYNDKYSSTDYTGLDGNGFFAEALYTDKGESSFSAGGFPKNGELTINGVPYSLACGSDGLYEGKDSIRLTQDCKTVSMELNTIGVFDKIYVLGTAGGPGTGNYADFSVTLQYTDGTISTTKYALYDWYDGTPVDGVYKDKRFRRASNLKGLDNDSSTDGGPLIQSATIEADESKLLKTITFEMVSKVTVTYYGEDEDEDTTCNGLYCGIYAVTGKTVQGAPQKTTAVDAVTVNNNSFTASWNAISGATSYRIDVATDPDFTKILTAYNNKDVGNVTSHVVTGLQEGTTYYYRVRVVNDNGQSLSSDAVMVTTLTRSHSWEFSSNKSILTAKCKGAGNGCTVANCEYGTDEKAISITLTANSVVYNGNAVSASITGTDKWTSVIGTVPEIIYFTDANLAQKTSAVNGAAGEGKAPINAGTYYAAITVGEVTAKKEFTINKISLTNENVTLDKDAFVVNDNAQGPVVSVSASVNGINKVLTSSDYDITGNISETNVSDAYALNVTGKVNYDGTVTKYWRIDKKNIEYTAPALKENPVTYTGTELEVINAGTTEAGSFEYQVVEKNEAVADDKWTAEEPGIINAGEYDIWYRIGGDAKHNAVAATKIGTFAVGKASVDAPAIASKVYSGSNLTADVETSTLYDVTKNEGGISTGEYDVVLNLTDSANYKWSDSEDVEKTLKFVITATENSWITEPAIDDVSYGTPVNAVYAASFGNDTIIITYEGVDGTDYASSTVAPTVVGNYEANFEVAATSDYSSLTKNVKFKINKSEATTSTAPIANILTYNGQAQALITEGTSSDGKLQYKLGADGTYADTVPTAVDAGTYTVYYKIVGDGNHIDLDETPVQVTISRLDVAEGTVGTFSNMTYNGSVQTPSATVTVGTLVATGTWSNVTNVSDTTTFTASGNFTGVIADKTTGMAKIPVSEPTIASKVYNGSLQKAEVIASTLYTTTANDGGIEVGIYDVVLTLADAVNYKWTDSEAASTTVKFEITARPKYAIYGYSDAIGNAVSADPQNAEKDTKVTLAIAPADEYSLQTISVTNASGAAITLTVDNTFLMPESEVSVSAVFIKNTYDITNYSDAVGNAVTADVNNASKGTKVSLTITNAPEYALHTLTVTDANGVAIPVATDNTFIMPGTAVTISAVFAQNTYDITGYSDVAGNAVTADLAKAFKGDKVALTVSTAAKYKFRSLAVSDAAGNTVTVAADNTFIMPGMAVTVTAVFEKDEEPIIIIVPVQPQEPANTEKTEETTKTEDSADTGKTEGGSATEGTSGTEKTEETSGTEGASGTEKNEDNSGAEGTSDTESKEGTKGNGESANAEKTEDTATSEDDELVATGVNPITEKKNALVLDNLISTKTDGKAAGATGEKTVEENSEDNGGEAAAENGSEGVAENSGENTGEAGDATGETTTEAEKEAAINAEREAVTKAMVEAIETAIAESGTKDFVLKADEQTVTEQGIENKAYADAATEEITEITKPSETKSVTLESAVMEALASAEGVESLTVMTSVADVEFDTKTIESINEQSDGSVQLVVTLLKEEIAQTAGENNKVYFDVSLIKEDGTKISTFDGGNLKVTVPIPKACQNEPVVVVYTDNKGHFSPVDGRVNTDGTYTFITAHLSEYVLMTKREAEKLYNSIYDFSTLKAHVEERTADSITIDWDQYEDADGYIIYGNYCNHDGETYKVKKLATITDPAKTEYIINGLEEGINYKFRIKAYKLINGEKYVTVKSHYVHAVTLGGKQRVTADIKIDQTGMKKTNTVTLKEGQSYTIDAERLTDNGKAVHHVTMHYESSDASVATVSLRSGKITATGKGTCNVLAIAENGLYEEITVKVE